MRTNHVLRSNSSRFALLKLKNRKKEFAMLFALAITYTLYRHTRSTHMLHHVPGKLSSLSVGSVQPPTPQNEKRANAMRTLFLIPGDENRCGYRYDYVCKFWFYIRCYVFASFQNVKVLSQGPKAFTEFVAQAKDGDIAAVVWRSKNHSLTPDLLSSLLQWRRESRVIGKVPRVRIGVFHIANENNRSNWKWYGLPDFVIRNYWIASMPSHVTFVPLGHQLPNRCIPWTTKPSLRKDPVCTCRGMRFKLASKRTFIWNFSGSLRRRRAELLRHLRASDVLRTKGYLHVSKKFGGDGLFGSETQNPKNSYLESVLESQFVFAPCGNAMETHRIYEAIALGAIPVIENCDPAMSHFFPFRELLIDGGPSGMVDFVCEFVGKPDAVDELQAKVQAWWHKYQNSIATNVSLTIITHVPAKWKSVP